MIRIKHTQTHTNTERETRRENDKNIKRKWKICTGTEWIAVGVSSSKCRLSRSVNARPVARVLVLGLGLGLQ